jgi:hypothetical protein
LEYTPFYKISKPFRQEETHILKCPFKPSVLDSKGMEDIILKNFFHRVAKTPFSCYKKVDSRGFSKPAILSGEPKRVKPLRWE